MGFSSDVDVGFLGGNLGPLAGAEATVVMHQKARNIRFL